jgi:hypothetical protein
VVEPFVLADPSAPVRDSCDTAPRSFETDSGAPSDEIDEMSQNLVAVGAKAVVLELVSDPGA